ncbi:MAG: Tol-Pal system beta propeller repeat protein TolB [Pseudomonadota bacterium]
MLTKLLRYGCVLIFLLAAMPVRAALDIEIVGAGEHQIPISVVQLAGDEKTAQGIRAVILSDLNRTGLFKLVDPGNKAPHEPREVVYENWPGVDALVIGSVTNAGGRVEAKFRLLDMAKKSELIAQAVSAKSDQVRAVGHRIADMIYEKLTGDKGVFSTRIAYINRQGKTNRLVVADSDGYGEQTVLLVNEPIMSPSWSPDGTHLAYVTFENNHAVVYAQSLLTNQRVLVANFRGSNSAPAWSPDGKQLALVLTRDGGSNIYLVRPDGSNLRRITFSGAIDTEPNFSPDGQFIIFSSDRGGSVQIYQIPAEGGTAERLTFEGGNNFSPRYSPDGKSFVFSHWNNGKFFIVTEDFQTKQMQTLTSGGWEKKPSFSPNGRLVLYATEAQGRGILATVSSDGRVKQKMFSQAGDVREPTWGPFLK